jgi:carotenoid 1,2-hydratase
MSEAPISSPSSFRFSSSINGDALSANDGVSHRCWYFDALSDDGRDAIVIIFFDNFIFSPRYNSQCQTGKKAGKMFPTLAFFYYREGRILHRAMVEHPERAFAADAENPGCKIGTNSFKFDAAPYGKGYDVRIDAEMKTGRRIKANLEWLIVEGDRKIADGEGAQHDWNLVAPRCDVTGKVELIGREGPVEQTIQFRGTGYHDQKSDRRWLPDALQKSFWGRAHFGDITAVFYHTLDCGSDTPLTKLLLSSTDKLTDVETYCEEKNFVRNMYWLKYPKRVSFYSRDNVRLRLKQLQVIDANPFYLRFLSEAILTVGDGTPRKTQAIVEYLHPAALKHRWLDHLTDMRISRLA